MKKILIAGMTFAGAIGLFAQGSLNFNNFVSGNPETVGQDIIFHVFSPDLNSPATEFTGNGSVTYSASARSGDFPAGATTYTGVPIGGSAVGSGSAGYGNGNNYDVALYALPGDNNAGVLQFVAGTLTTFQTSSAAKAGWIIAPALAPQIPGTTFSGSGDTTDPQSATVQIRAWYNNGGLDTTYAEAVAAGMPAGEGTEFNVDALGGGTSNPANMINGSSFSLTTVPEPSTIALGVVGACAFLARRRRS